MGERGDSGRGRVEREGRGVEMRLKFYVLLLLGAAEREGATATRKLGVHGSSVLMFL